MAVTREQKRAQLDDLKVRLQKAASVVFTTYTGLNVADLSDLRRKIRASGAEMKVAKKTLIRIASEECKIPTMGDSELPGPVACIFSDTDPIGGPQAALAFSKEHKQVTFLGGLFEGKLLSKNDALTLASVPPRPVLLATFAGMIRSPLTKFASMCNSPLTGFARAVAELSKKKAA